MDEYISRQMAIEALGDEPESWNDTDAEIAERNQWRLDSLAIEAVPSADVIPVIRCRDCKHYFAYPDYFSTCHEHYEIDGASRKVSPDSFCSFGVRREDS